MGLTFHHRESRLYLDPLGDVCSIFKLFRVVFVFEPGTHLSSHIVSNIVFSAAHVLTVVFGMGTGVSHGRIGTRIFIRFS